MTMHNKSAQEAVNVYDLDVVDFVLIDHRFMKECIGLLTNDSGDKRKKLMTARAFFDAFHFHSEAEKKVIYHPLKDHEELHFNILEAETEHRNIELKIKQLKGRVQRVRILRDEMEAELKIMAEMVKHHLMEEESEFLPKLREALPTDSLKEMGSHFMKLRKFTGKDLIDYPHLHDELIQWKDSIQKISSKFLTKMDKFVENMQH